MERENVPFHVTYLDGKTIVWTDFSDQRVISVRDPDSSEPARRVTDSGWALLGDDEPQGLTVYGNHKWDRVPFDNFAKVAPEYAYLVDGIREGRGVTEYNFTG